MSNSIKNRAGEPAHVIAAKNMADRAGRLGVKRADFLETLSKRQGYASWNAYREAGSVRIDLPLALGGAHTLRPGPVSVTAATFLPVAQAALSSASKSGYDCDHSGPVVISDRIEAFQSLTRAAGGLAIKPEIGHRGFLLVEGLPNDLALDLVRERMTGISGLVVLDLPGVSAQTIRAMVADLPGSIILCHPQVGEPDIWEDGRNTFIGREADNRMLDILAIGDSAHDDDMWRMRAFAMVLAFAQSGQVYDSRNKPSIDTVDPAHPAMTAFLSSLPGYSFEKRERGDKQDMKTHEQFGFLTMQM